MPPPHGYGREGTLTNPNRPYYLNSMHKKKSGKTFPVSTLHHWYTISTVAFEYTDRRKIHV
jgi:hypothetical protein